MNPKLDITYNKIIAKVMKYTRTTRNRRNTANVARKCHFLKIRDNVFNT
jgi:hypothetical protein